MSYLLPDAFGRIWSITIPAVTVFLKILDDTEPAILDAIFHATLGVLRQRELFLWLIIPDGYASNLDDP